MDDELADREDVIRYICTNHLGRRNLTKTQSRYFIGRKYNAEKQGHGGARKASTQNGDLPDWRTVDRIASQYGIGKSTVERYGYFAEAVDLLEQYVTGVREKVLSSSNTRITDAEVKAILCATDEELVEYAVRILNGDMPVVVTDTQVSEEQNIIEGTFTAVDEDNVEEDIAKLFNQILE